VQPMWPGRTKAGQALLLESFDPLAHGLTITPNAVATALGCREADANYIDEATARHHKAWLMDDDQRLLLDSDQPRACNHLITRNKDKKESSFGEAAMFFRRRTGFAGGVLATALLLGTTIAASDEAAKKIKIGVVYDYSGPMAAGGSDLHVLGTKIMIDYFNNKGGVEGYQIEPIYADAQSKPEVAINEAVRLIEQEKVDILL